MCDNVRAVGGLWGESECGATFETNMSSCEITIRHRPHILLTLKFEPSE